MFLSITSFNFIRQKHILWLKIITFQLSAIQDKVCAIHILIKPFIKSLVSFQQEGTVVILFGSICKFVKTVN